MLITVMSYINMFMIIAYEDSNSLKGIGKNGILRKNLPKSISYFILLVKGNRFSFFVKSSTNVFFCVLMTHGR